MAILFIYLITNEGNKTTANEALTRESNCCSPAAKFHIMSKFLSEFLEKYALLHRPLRCSLKCHFEYKMYKENAILALETNEPELI